MMMTEEMKKVADNVAANIRINETLFKECKNSESDFDIGLVTGMVYVASKHFGIAATDVNLQKMVIRALNRLDMYKES